MYLALQKSSVIFFCTIVLLCTACGSLSNLRSTDNRSKVASNALVASAKQYLGSPYRYGGTSKGKGFDCSGLTYTVFQENGILLKRQSHAQYTQGVRIDQKDARPGDLIFFKKGGKIFHVGIVSANKAGSIVMIHSSKSKGVIEQPIQNSYYWEDKVAGVRRVN